MENSQVPFKRVSSLNIAKLLKAEKQGNDFLREFICVK
jgi:hypothetical protein